MWNLRFNSVINPIEFGSVFFKMAAFLIDWVLELLLRRVHQSDIIVIRKVLTEEYSFVLFENASLRLNLIVCIEEGSCVFLVNLWFFIYLNISLDIHELVLELTIIGSRDKEFVCIPVVFALSITLFKTEEFFLILFKVWMILDVCRYV